MNLYLECWMRRCGAPNTNTNNVHLLVESPLKPISIIRFFNKLKDRLKAIINRVQANCQNIWPPKRPLKPFTMQTARIASLIERRQTIHVQLGKLFFLHFFHRFVCVEFSSALPSIYWLLWLRRTTMLMIVFRHNFKYMYVFSSFRSWRRRRRRKLSSFNLTVLHHSLYSRLQNHYRSLWPQLNCSRGFGCWYFCWSIRICGFECMQVRV